MILNLNKRRQSIIISIAILIAVIPFAIAFFELFTTDKKSVVFLDGYPASIAILAFSYYAVLIILGIFWFTKQIITFFKLKNETSKAELLHLKNQVNPHFFFNTLNNLYGLVAVNPKKAQELILKLSDMMRYSIYEGEKEVVLLKDEVEYLKNYIELHKMRYHKEISIEFKNQIDENYKVMPLLFIILLENAFKHGIDSLSENAFVNINLYEKDNAIYFEIENNFDAKEKNESSGIGLKNLKKRLSLVYKNNHELKTSITKNIYKTTLKTAKHA